MKYLFSILAIVSGTLLCSPWSSQLALGAQGYGAGATGGAGKPTYWVSNLSTGTSSGSLRQALGYAKNSGGGTINFSVGGVINFSQSGLDRLEIPSNVTIAGETAPDVPGKPPGITIYGIGVRVGKLGEATQNVIVRHVRFRDKDRNRPTVLYPMDVDCFEIYDSHTVLVQYCSMAWGNDGTLDIWQSSFVTVEYCIIAETLEPHSKGMQVTNNPSTDGWITIHHNLFVSHRERSPLMQTSSGGTNHVEVYNNVVYNWGQNGDGTHFDFANPAKANIISNYYKPGPSTTQPGPLYAVYVRSGSYAYAPDLPTPNGNKFVNGAGPVRWESGSFNTYPTLAVYPSFAPEPANDSLYGYVLLNAGPNGPRDTIDFRLLGDVINGTGSIKSNPPPNEVSELIAAGT